MRVLRETARAMQGYSLEDAADFLEYDRVTVEYWLRMGHIDGQWDARRNTWKIKPQALIDFLRQSHEPMPTGTLYRDRQHAAQPATAGADA